MSWFGCDESKKKQQQTTAAGFKTTKEEQEEDAAVSLYVLAASKEIGIAAVASALLELGGLFASKEEQRVARKAFPCRKDDFALHPTGAGKSSLGHFDALLLATGQ